MQKLILILCILNTVKISLLTTSDNGKLGSKQLKQSQNIKLPACQACKWLLDSFNSELQLSTKKLSEENQIKEDTTLDDLTILQDVFLNLCREERAKNQCLTLADKCKNDLQKWWTTEKQDHPDLFSYLCIKKLHYCCPNGRYGPDCTPCPGFPDRVCSNNGKCKGNGTRKGNGQCSCDIGYSGNLCDECAPSYYASYKDNDKLLCTRCHSACGGDCTQAGPRGCLTCREGWRLNKSKGCVDVNECFSKRSPCKRNEFCVNNEGSYSCLACDPACDTCTGDGPDMCDKCASGFVLKDNICVSEKHYVSYSDITRYLTYAGLCFATYIIFQNSPWAASVIGLFVAIYVTVSEYILGNLSPINFFSFTKMIEILENMWQKH